MVVDDRWGHSRFEMDDREPWSGARIVSRDDSNATEIHAIPRRSSAIHAANPSCSGRNARSPRDPIDRSILF